jgi:thiamine kinase-like enzyme
VSTSEPEASARAALRLSPHAAFLAAAPFEPVPGGVSNHSWRVRADGGDFYVRLGFGNEASLGVDRVSEALLLAVASEAGLAPPVLACEPRRNLLVMQWIHGRSWSKVEAADPTNVARAGVALGRVHALPAPPGLHRVDFDEVAGHLRAQIDASQGQALDRRLEQRSESAFRRLAGRVHRRVPCHNDLHHLNLVDDGSRLWLVDWEYGGLGDPLVDLAAYCCHHDLDAAGRRILIEAHDGLSTSEQGLLTEACLAFDYVQWLWYRLRRLPAPPALLGRLSRATD